MLGAGSFERSAGARKSRRCCPPRRSSRGSIQLAAAGTPRAEKSILPGASRQPPGWISILPEPLDSLQVEFQFSPEPLDTLRAENQFSPEPLDTLRAENQFSPEPLDSRRLHRQHQLAHRLARLDRPVRVRGPIQRERRHQRRRQATLFQPAREPVHRLAQDLRLVEQVRQVERQHALVVVAEIERVEARHPEEVDRELRVIRAAALPRQHRVEAVHDELPRRCQVPVALPQRLDPVRVEDHVVALGRVPLRRRPERLAALVDHRVGAEAPRRLDLVRRAHHADHAAAGDLAELHQRAAHAAGGRVHQQDHARPQPHELEQRVIRRHEHRREPRRLLRREPRRQREDLVARNHDARGVAAEADHADDGRPRREIRDALAERGDRARDLEAGRDGPADVLLRRLVEAHTDDAIRVVDARRLHVDQHLAAPGDRVGVLLDAELVVAAGLVDDDLAHGHLLGCRGLTTDRDGERDGDGDGGRGSTPIGFEKERRSGRARDARRTARDALDARTRAARPWPRGFCLTGRGRLALLADGHVARTPR
ncbi:uncharacterized protein SOCE836_065540 [Sorangium cellulosum]|uniref:Uncharacterized protein n=1 Tax=Sorangium cellulosum TaxID=56 RepID=A0A4P2QW68_SORCE|nr:uncharacterized protein SOCE836_065540 [Sorangium cellulosum]